MEQAKRESFQVEPEIEEFLRVQFNLARAYPGWANARDVKTIWDSTKKKRTLRVHERAEKVRTISQQDVKQAFSEFLESRKVTDQLKQSPNQPQSPPVRAQPLVQAQEPRPPPVQAQEKSLGQQEETQRKEQTQKSESPNIETKPQMENYGERDAGVSDAIWEELEKAKKEHFENLEKKKKEEEIEEERKRQELIREICPCPAGYQWFQVGGGWRCGGGSHFVSNEMLEKRFTRTRPR